MLPDDLITGLLSINADHWRSMPINAHQCWINSAWSGIDQHWSALIGIDRHWHQCRDFDRHWALIEGILCHSCKVSQFVLALTKSGRLFDMAKSKVWQMNEKLMLRTHICKHTRITSPKPPSAMVSSRIILLSDNLGILIRYDSRVIRSSSSDISSSSEEVSLLLLTANLRGRPLFILGGVVRIFANNFFFSATLRTKFFLGGDPPNEMFFSFRSMPPPDD